MNKHSKSIPALKPAVRISLGLIMLTLNILFIADLLGFVPNPAKSNLESRKTISESFAIQFSALANDGDLPAIRKTLTQIVKRNDDILSAGYRSTSGILLFQAGDHQKLWGNHQTDKSSSTHVIVPIFRGKAPSGSIELRFRPLPSMGFNGLFDAPVYKLAVFVLIFGFSGFLFFILRTRRQLDPAAVIPERVNAAFDTLAEGVLILDDKEQIVLANTSFAEKTDRPANSLLGIKASELNWHPPFPRRFKLFLSLDIFAAQRHQFDR